MDRGTCEFCDLLLEDDYPLKLDESEHWLTCLSFQQHYPGRGIIVLKRHARSFSELSLDELQDFQVQQGRFENALSSALGADAVNVALLMNGAMAADSPEPHVHFHIIPRYRNPIEVFGHVFEDVRFGTHYDPEAPEFLDKGDRKELASRIKSEIPVHVR